MVISQQLVLDQDLPVLMISKEVDVVGLTIAIVLDMQSQLEWSTGYLSLNTLLTK